MNKNTEVIQDKHSNHYGIRQQLGDKVQNNELFNVCISFMYRPRYTDRHKNSVDSLQNLPLSKNLKCVHGTMVSSRKPH